MDNLEEIDKFLEKYNLPRLNQKEIEICEQISYKYWNWICDLKFPTNKSPEPEGFTDEFYQTFREELTPILVKVVPRNAEERTLPNSF